MQNPERIEAFYKDYLSGQDSKVTVFEVQKDGLADWGSNLYLSERAVTDLLHRDSVEGRRYR